MTVAYKAGNQITGLSTDTKPSNQAEGSVFTETDTLVISDYTGGAWVARSAGGRAIWELLTYG
jgi:hypothetical protein